MEGFYQNSLIMIYQPLQMQITCADGFLESEKSMSIYINISISNCIIVGLW